MPFDSEGVFSRLHNWEDDRINDIDIVTDHMDEEDDNFADGLSQCFLKNGNSKMEGNLDAGNFKVTNVADGALPSDAVNRGQLDKASSDVRTTVKEVMNSLVKVGDIKASVIAENHDNWLLCDGQAVSRAEYADLFALIGDNFGEGNGVTTFNIPDYRGRFLRGLGGNSAEDIYTAQAEGLPDITGSFTANRFGWGGIAAAGALSGETTGGQGSDYGSNGPNVKLMFKAGDANEIYGASEHVTPENYAVNWFIKAKKEE